MWRWLGASGGWFRWRNCAPWESGRARRSGGRRRGGCAGCIAACTRSVGRCCHARGGGLSDVLCEVGVTDSALVGRERPPCPPRRRSPSRESPRRAPWPESPRGGSTDRLAGLLPADELEDALKGLEPEQITGPGGLLTQLAGRVIETALGAELTDHLGYPPGQAPPGGAANTRNGSTAKTVKTELGAVRDQDAPRPRGELRAAAGGQAPDPAGRAGRPDPRALRRRHERPRHREPPRRPLRRGDQARHDLAGSPTPSSKTSPAWRTRPLDGVYPIVYFDCLMVKVREDRSVRTRACYLAIGVTVEGDREVLGIWWQETEGAKFWLAVLNDLHQRGVQDVLVACVDGLTGLPRGDRGRLPPGVGADLHRPPDPQPACATSPTRTARRVAADLKPVYRAVNADAAADALEAFDEHWGEKYPMIAAVLARRAGNTSSRSSRCPPTSGAPSTPPTASRTSTARSARASRPAATSPTNRPPPSSSTSPSNEPNASGAKAYNWTGALRGLKIHFGDRLPD